ncbi:unnamed protein product [Heterobilharzia americana]|nr:unnamed protein product [Heterobilharzia americana]
MLFTTFIIPTFLILNTFEFSVSLPVDYSRNLLLRQLLNFQLPKDSSFQSVSSLSATAWNPTLSALFWTQWSKWKWCSPDKHCTLDNKTITNENIIYRTRICRFQSMNDHLLWSQTMIKGVKLTSDMIPCSEEGSIEKDIQKCSDIHQCISDNSPRNYSVNEQPSSLIKATSSNCEGAGCDFKDNTKISIATEASRTMGRYIKHNQIWGPWIALQQCSTIIPTIDELPEEYPWESMLNFSRTPAGRRCEPGLQLQMRKLLNQSVVRNKLENIQSEENLSSLPMTFTTTTISETRKVHCWINEACPISDVKVEPPITCVFQAIFRSPSVQVKWRRTPYGRMPSHFEVHVLDLINSVHYRKSELYVEQIKLNKLDPWGENYVTEIFGLKIGQPYEISIASADEMGNIYFSKICEAIVIIGAGDGSWSNWSYWSNCNSKCSSKLGIRSRYRKCNSPTPRNGGRMCPGPEQMNIECFGTNINC